MNIKRVGKGVGIFFVLLIGTKVVQVVDGWKAAMFPPKAETTEEVVADKLDKPTPKLTSEELQKFRTLVGDIDTMNDLVTGMAQWNESQVVYVTVSLEFARLSKLEKGEVAVALHNSLSQICQCSPILNFKTSGGQDVGKIVTTNRPRFN